MIFAALIFKNFPFVGAESDIEMLSLLTSIFGTDEIVKLNLKYGIDYPEEFEHFINKKTPLENFKNI